MKLRQFAALSGLSMIAAPMVASLAMAAPSWFSTHKDSKGAVYFGGSPSSELSVTVGGLTKTKNLKANACGLALVKGSTTTPAPTSFTIGANTINASTLPTQILPKCSTAGVLEEARTSNFKTSDGTVVVVGQTANSSIVMSYLASAIKKVKLNACGFGKISNSTTKPFASTTTFMPAGGSTLSYSSISTKAPYLCSKDGVTYQPQSLGS